MTLQELLGEELYTRVSDRLEEANQQGEAAVTLRVAEQGAQTEAEYRAQIASLTEQLSQTRLDAALRTALVQAGAEDVDYLAYKLREGGTALALNERGELADWKQTLTRLKTAFPRQFTTGEEAIGTYQGYKPMPEGIPGNREGLSRSELLKKPYHQRLELYRQDPEGFLSAFR